MGVCWQFFVWDELNWVKSKISLSRNLSEKLSLNFGTRMGEMVRRHWFTTNHSLEDNDEILLSIDSRESSHFIIIFLKEIWCKEIHTCNKISLNIIYNRFHQLRSSLSSICDTGMWATFGKVKGKKDCVPNKHSCKKNKHNHVFSVYYY